MCFWDCDKGGVSLGHSRLVDGAQDEKHIGTALVPRQLALEQSKNVPCRCSRRRLQLSMPLWRPWWRQMANVGDKFGYLKGYGGRLSRSSKRASCNRLSMEFPARAGRRSHGCRSSPDNKSWHGARIRFLAQQAERSLARQGWLGTSSTPAQPEAQTPSTSLSQRGQTEPTSPGPATDFPSSPLCSVHRPNCTISHDHTIFPSQYSPIEAPLRMRAYLPGCKDGWMGCICIT